MTGPGPRRAPSSPNGRASAPPVASPAHGAPHAPTGPLPTRSLLDDQVKLRRAGELLCQVGQILADIHLDATPDPRLMEPVKPVRYLTAKDIAQRLQVDQKTVRRWHQCGRMPKGVTIGTVLRWPVETIDSWLEETR